MNFTKIVIVWFYLWSERKGLLWASSGPREFPKPSEERKQQHLVAEALHRHERLHRLVNDSAAATHAEMIFGRAPELSDFPLTEVGFAPSIYSYKNG